MPSTGPGIPRVAVTVEQSWHAVPGGTALSVLHTLAALRRRYDVELVGVAAHHRAAPAAPFVPPIPVRHLPLPRRALYQAWQTTRWPPVQRATGAVDLIHATTMAIPPRTAPLVVTVHDLAFLHAPEHFSSHGNRFFRRGLELTRRDADLVIVPSADTARDCTRAGIAPDRIRLIPHGVRLLPVSAADIERVRRAHGLHRPYVLWCGTIEPRKNVPRLVEAFALLAERDAGLDLVLVGPKGWGEVGPAAGRHAARIHTLGFVAEAELHALYAGARAFAYPSLREGFGMPVLEAMAHGVPVVTSTGTPMAELVGGAGLLVDPTDTAALARAIGAAMGGEHDGLAAHARQRAAAYSWDAAAELTMAVYRELRGT